MPGYTLSFLPEVREQIREALRRTRERKNDPLHDALLDALEKQIKLYRDHTPYHSTVGK